MSKTEFTPTPVCPYCERPDRDWWDHAGDLRGDGDTETFTCGHCDLDYHVSMHMSISFTTRSMDGVFQKEVERHEKWLALVESDPEGLRKRWLPAGASTSDFDVLVAQRRVELLKARQRLETFQSQRKARDEVVEEAEEGLE